ncbi:uncharacterized protein si:ch211-14a17.10 isoform X2 [Lampris incognitus]|uniref:uncharacterized protein si:ch211-14a17.10 isoform X2 n=1 Tax=Lampris incognitus TaxID=2546036 RepID=UPI0024B569E1|nr:uncharacterized protein si:ch211-14a17.10 isoform X2 [Lampris incognitus]
MTGRSHILWAHLILCSVFQVSFNRHLDTPFIIKTEAADGGSIFSRLPIVLPEGIDPKNVNVTTVFLKTCTGAREEVSKLNIQLRDSTALINQLDQKVSGLRNEAQLLRVDLVRCRATVSTTNTSFQVQLDRRLSELQRISEDDRTLILKITDLVSKVNTLKEKILSATNTAVITELQKKLGEATLELKTEKQRLETNHPMSQLVFQIITLQNEIWDLERKESQHYNYSSTTATQIQVLQEQLDRQIIELRGESRFDSFVVELISVINRIAEKRKLIVLLIDESKRQSSDSQKQWRQLIETLKNKILQLTNDENNKQLTMDIMDLQSQLAVFNDRSSRNTKIITDRIKEFRGFIEVEKRRQEELRKELEKEDFIQADMILRIISLMKQTREERYEDQYTTTPTTPTTTTEEIIKLQNALQDKERELSETQKQIKDLQAKLQQKDDSCSELQNKYETMKDEIEDKISELSRGGERKVALVLGILELNNVLSDLETRLLTKEDEDKTSDMEEIARKREELKAKYAELEKLIPTSNLVSEILLLQSSVRDLLGRPVNRNTMQQFQTLQNELERNITANEADGNENINLVLKIMTLQNQVEWLQKQLSNPQFSQSSEVTRLTNQLEVSKGKLQNLIDELNDKSQANSRLTLKILELQNQLREIAAQHLGKAKTWTVMLTQLREEMEAKTEENTRSQAQIKHLQHKLQKKEAECSGTQQRLDVVQKNLDDKLKELEAKSDTVTSLALQVSILMSQLQALNTTKQSTEDEDKVKELQEIINEKNIELASKTAQLNDKSSQGHRLLQIFMVQTEVEHLYNNDSEANRERIEVLQNHLKGLIGGIQNENDEATQQIFQLMILQFEKRALNKEKEDIKAYAKKIEELENELGDKRKLLEETTERMVSSKTEVVHLTSKIMALLGQIKQLETNLFNLNQARIDKAAEVERKLELITKQLEDSKTRFRNSDAENVKLMLDIVNLSNNLKELETNLSKTREVDENQIEELQEQLQTLGRNHQQLETRNTVLEKTVKELDLCCSNVNDDCDDVRRQLEQSLEDADQLRRELREKDAINNRMQRELRELEKEKNDLQYNYNTLENERKKLQDIIDDFQKFDPNTANPRVLVSSDKTELSIDAEQQDVVDHPGRFNVALAALGRTGYSSGRHYWEVSLVGKLCYNLGMASESANRRGILRLQPANGYWTITLNKQGFYRAMDRRPVPLEHRRAATLGILLDHSKGQISFYDSGTRAHIYSFVGQVFTDKIYPFINTCTDADDNVPIVLIPPGPVTWIK